ncbi:hypothetical protein N7478_008159 [Penicillium angulare]|uniref:uncharacterized protein n=1 Tax=Penicillium angulare TaxID=116970 RepID=UPI00253FAA74|nr:uncharacterized protein N7478_008159 [Penicillium angulare]KAJ5273034.1 hypothetical protein N7478_008159 [Penicillium angulare]
MAEEGSFDALPEAAQIKCRENKKNIRNYYAKIDEITAFFNKSRQNVGYAFMTSGMKLKKFHGTQEYDMPTQLDWALCCRVSGDPLSFCLAR